MKEEKIFYQLVTKDGIKSEIKKADHITLEVQRIVAPKSRTLRVEEIEFGESVVNSRRYVAKKQESVLLITYEEED